MNPISPESAQLSPAAAPPRLSRSVPLWGFTLFIGLLFALFCAAIPMGLFMAPTHGAAVAVTAVNLGLCAFFGYALRGLVRTLRGDPNASIVAPGLVRPLSLVLGLAAIAAGVAGLLHVGGLDSYSSTRALGGGAMFLMYGLTRKRR